MIVTLKKSLPGLLFLFMGLCGSVAGQEQQEHAPGHYIDEEQRYYQQAKLPVYLFISHSPDAQPNQLATAEGEQATGTREPIYLDGHGVHYLKHTDQLDNTLQTFAIHADGRAPVTTSTLGEAKASSTGDTRYFGSGHSVSLEAKDGMSGLKALYYAVNGQAWASYTSTIRFDKEGPQRLRYYAVDRVGNVEEAGQMDFVVDLSAPETYHNVIGVAKGNVISTNTQLYLTMGDSISGLAATYYKFDDGDYKTYRGGILPFASLPDGDHTVYYYSVDKVGNKEEAGSYAFYLDKTAPIMSSDVLGDRFIVDDQVYFSGRTKLKLTAVDNKSGIKEVRYSVDGADFEEYNEPFYLPSVAGVHTVRYYALDNMQNQGTGSDAGRVAEYRHTVSKVYVDLTGPTLSHRFTGPTFQKGDSVYINNKTKMVLSATDPESGLQYISYRVDSKGEEVRYDAPFSVSGKGFHRVDFFGYDNVNNRNVEDFLIMVDDEGPQIQTTFSVAPVGEKDGVPVYPSYVTLFISSTDQQSGYNEIRYSLDGGATDKVYGQPVSGFKKDTVITMTITATDKLGNPTTQSVTFRTATY